jgi:hypothetical protein
MSDWEISTARIAQQKQWARLTVTPIAVTSAPAPAPWMMSGRGEYLAVSYIRYSAIASLPSGSERDNIV